MQQAYLNFINSSSEQIEFGILSFYMFKRNRYKVECENKMNKKSSLLIWVHPFNRFQTMVGLKANVKEKPAGSQLDTSREGIVFLQVRWLKSSKILISVGFEEKIFYIFRSFALYL